MRDSTCSPIVITVHRRHRVCNGIGHRTDYPSIVAVYVVFVLGLLQECSQLVKMWLRSHVFIMFMALVSKTLVARSGASDNDR